jgi:hypothetical protein
MGDRGVSPSTTAINAEISLRSGMVDNLGGTLRPHRLPEGSSDAERLFGYRKQKYRPKAVSLMAFPDANAGKRELR